MPLNQQNPYGPPQQNSNGGYDVVPPLPSTPNAGHSGHNPYEFIVNPPQHKRPGLFGGGSPLRWLLLVVGAVVIFIIVTAVLLSAFAPKGPTQPLISTVQRQQEITRIADDAIDDSASQDLRNFAANVSAAVRSSQSGITDYLTSHGTKIKPKELALDQSAQTDELLSNAQANGTYDNAVKSNLTDQLNEYQGLLKKAYDASGNKALKRLLQNSADANATLLQQAKSL